MRRVSESVTVSLDRPRTVVLYVLFCFGCLALSLALANVALLLLSRYG